MVDSKEEQYFNGVGSFTRQDNEDVEKEIVDDMGAIPVRYQNGLGGIDIEQVRRDQRQAKQQFIQAILRYLLRQR